MDVTDSALTPAEGREPFRRYALWYTLVIAAVGALVFLPFFRTGRSFVWMLDGLAQHFPKLAFLNEAVRDAVRSLLAGEGWTFPLFRFDRPLVAPDTQYGLLQFLAVLWPQGKIDSFYTFYVLLNYYLAGLSFTYFGWWFRQRRTYVLAGAVSYTFCGFALFAGVRHPFFLEPMCLLPLLLVGVEKVMRRERSWLLTAAVFLSVTTSFGVYFSCMQAVFLGLYVCVRFFDLYEEDRPREFIRLLGRLAAWAGTGALLGCFTALPTLLEIFGGDRVGADIWGYTNPFFYGKNHVKRFLTYFFVVPTAVGRWMRLGFSAMCLPAIVLLFLRRERKTRVLRVLFLVLTVMHLVPAAAYVMSGFSNISNRFCFGYAFCVAAILMFMLPRMAELPRRTAAVLGAAVTAYVGLCAVLYAGKDMSKVLTVAETVLPAAALAGLCLFAGRGRLRRFFPPVCLGVACVCAVISGSLIYTEKDEGYLTQFCSDPYEELGRGQYASLANSGKTAPEDGTFFRTMGDDVYVYDFNSACLYGQNGLTAYPYYGQSAQYLQWLREMEAPRSCAVHVTSAQMRQPHLLTLANVRYYASGSQNAEAWPYGFREVDRVANGQDTDVILENENWLPLGYTYDSYITREAYEKLNAPERREAQMQAVVLDSAPRSGAIAEAQKLVFRARQIPCQVTAEEGLVWQDGKLEVAEENASLTLSFDGLPGAETYLRVVDLDLTKGDSTRSWDLTAATDKTVVYGTWHADAYVYANHQHTQLMDLGRSENGMGSVTLVFPKKGTVKLKDLQIWCQPMEGFAAQAKALRAESLENVRTNWRGLTGTVSVSRDKVLCIALPWLDGWTAYVDGEQTPLHHANTAFMGVELPAGEHTVELRYQLPGLRIGLVLTGLGAACAAGLALSGRRKRRDL